MIRYGNQKKLVVKHENMCADSKYIKLSVDNIENTLMLLSPITLKVWLYLSKNKEGYEFCLSMSDVTSHTNISENSYRKAIQELVDNEYLTVLDNESNTYIFNSCTKKRYSINNTSVPKKDTGCTKKRYRTSSKSDVPVPKKDTQTIIYSSYNNTIGNSKIPKYENNHHYVYKIIEYYGCDKGLYNKLCYDIDNFAKSVSDTTINLLYSIDSISKCWFENKEDIKLINDKNIENWQIRNLSYAKKDMFLKIEEHSKNEHIKRKSDKAI